MSESTLYNLDQETNSLAEHVSNTVEAYFKQLDGDNPIELYDLVLGVVEPQILTAVMRFTRNNQSEAARILGISRGTLRTKLKLYFEDTYVNTRD